MLAAAAQLRGRCVICLPDEAEGVAMILKSILVSALIAAPVVVLLPLAAPDLPGADLQMVLQDPVPPVAGPSRPMLPVRHALDATVIQAWRHLIRT
jgi:hypothetical protein